jgi:gliding motility-associated-like protein
MNAVDQNHCRYTDTVKVNCINLICGQPNLVIPNAFSPNDDGVNDKMCFRGEWIREFHIAIFSRWGEKVFETNDINECWDGRYDGKKCQSGVYMYTCDIVCEDNQAGTFKGDVTIIQ